MKRLIFFLPILTLLTVVAGCEEPLEFDENEPFINSVSINSSTDAVVVNEGDSLQFSMSFEDDVSLQKYRILIQEKFVPLLDVIPFYYEEVFALDGELTTTETATVPIPAGTLAGNFSIMVEVMDTEGNLSTAVERDLTITSAGQPTVVMSQPDFVNGFAVTAGDTIPMVGTITDDFAIREIRVEISQEESRFFYYQYNQNDLFNVWSFDTLALDSDFVAMPIAATAGLYDLTVVAFDSLGNMTHQRAAVSVSE